MGYKYSDANFEDSNTMSELDGAQIYEPSKKTKKNTAHKAPHNEQRTRREADNRAHGRADGGAQRANNARANRTSANGSANGARTNANSAKRSAVAPAQQNKPMRKKEKKSASEVAVSAVRGFFDLMSTKSNTRVKTVKERKKRPLPISALAMAFVCTILLMFMIVSYVQINEYTVEVSSLRNELGNMVEKDKELTLELEKKNDMLAIEQKAGDLGMVKVDQLTKKHVTLTQDDKIEVVEPEPTGDSTVVTTIMSGIWQNFSGLWEYLG